jgi:hypothetical protein
MRCVSILSYTVPLYGNHHIFPYGEMLVEHQGEEKVVKFSDFSITFNRKRFFFRNVGDLYHPKFEFCED